MKGLIDNKGRLFGKISVIDLAIILLVIAVAIGAYIKFMVAPQTAVTIEAAPAQYTLEIQNVRDWAMHNIREGDQVFVTGVYVGTITSVTYGPHEATRRGEGSVFRATVPERFNVWLEIEATATVNDGRVMISRTVPMAMGNSPTDFDTRYASFYAIVREIHIGE